MNQRLDVIDFLKGFSITTIVLMHFIQSLPLPDIIFKATSFGGAGVHVFILCSGFGLYNSYLNKPLNCISFFKKRFIKVYIPYAIFILICAFLPLNTSPDKWIAVCSHLFLFKMFSSQYMDSFGGQMWFISMIFQCYFAFLILAYFFKRFGGNKMLIISLIISLLYATFVGIIGKSDERIWSSFFLQYLWEFVLGMYLALIYRNAPEKIKIPSWKYLVIGVVVGLPLVGIAGALGGVYKLYNDIPSLVAYISIALIVYKMGVKFVNRFFIFTNKFSFEWYLTHLLIFYYCSYFLKYSLSPWTIILISLVVSYTFGWLYSKILIWTKLK